MSHIITQRSQHPALARFASFSDLTESDLAALAPLVGTPQHFKRGEILCHEGERAEGLYLLLAGWTASSMLMASGDRQIIKIHMPGDLLGMPSLALASAIDTITSLTPAVVSVFPLTALRSLFESSPRLAALLLLISQEERVLLIDRLAVTSYNTAPGRLAALLLQIHGRVLRYDATLRDAFFVPLTQTQLGELLGMTPVHVNRAIQRLRQDGVITWKRGHVTILDHSALRRLSGLPERCLEKHQSWLPAAENNAQATQ